jgi:hypothetical protein
MPVGSIHKHMQELSPPPPTQPSKQGKETLCVAARRTQQAVPTFQGSHPAKDIQAPSMMAGRRDAERLAAPRPHPADSGVLTKARLVLKYHPVELFLSAAGGAPHLVLAPAGIHNCPASTDSPSDAAICAPGGRSTPLQSAAGGAPPKWDHPRPPEAVRPSQAPGDCSARASNVCRVTSERSMASTFLNRAYNKVRSQCHFT